MDYNPKTLEKIAKELQKLIQMLQNLAKTRVQNELNEVV